MPSTWRLFLAYAGASLIPVVLLGLVLTLALGHEVAGCDIVQGYLLARSMPAADLPAWLAGNRVGALLTD